MALLLSSSPAIVALGEAARDPCDVVLFVGFVFFSLGVAALFLDRSQKLLLGGVSRRALSELNAPWGTGRILFELLIVF